MLTKRAEPATTPRSRAWPSSNKIPNLVIASYAQTGIVRLNWDNCFILIR
jgi:hypothetical protein